jgi:two-component system, cell cycle sensor histidine kinase and response regulator CckA
VEERYRALLEINPLPVLIVDIATQTILEVNGAAIRRYGYPRDRFVGRGLHVIWGDEPALPPVEGSVERFAACLCGRCAHRLADGCSVEVTVFARDIQSGGQGAVLLVVEDLRPRRTAEEVEAVLSRLASRLMDTAAPVEAARTIAVYSRNVIEWDAFFLTLIAPETGRLEPVLHIDTFEGELRECGVVFPQGLTAEEIYGEVLKGKSQMILRGEGDGKLLPVSYGDVTRRSESLLFVPIRKESQVIGVLSVQSYRRQAYTADHLEMVEAIALHCGGAMQRLQAQAALQRAERRFRQVFEASPVAMSINRYDDGRTIDVNPAFLRLFGYSREEVLGRNGLELGFWQRREDRDEIFNDIWSGKSVRSRQKVMRTRTDEERHTLVSVEALDVEGERCLLFYNYDITDRLNLEAQLRQSQKLDSVGQLAAGVAHDFNNLLTVIDGCTSLVLATEPLDDRGRALLREVSSASERAAGLAKQLLAFSSRQKLDLQRICMEKLITDLGAMLRRLLGAQVALEVRCARDLPPVCGDPGMLEQVVLNMAVNARDAMPRGGDLVIAVAAVEVAERDAVKPPGVRAGRYLRLKISDTGLGIAPEYLPKLFDPFFTTKEEGKGSGLGLATAYGIVKQHGGWIKVRSKPGMGTVFSVYLPVAVESKKEQVEPSPPPELSDLRGRERVLVVEDEGPLRELLRDVLVCYGYDVLLADSAANGLEHWKGQKDSIDAVVTDIAMPGTMDGRDLGEQLLADRPDLPIVFISGYSLQLTGVAPLLGKGQLFLPKPFEAGKLAKAVRSAINSQSTAVTAPPD